MKAIVLNNFGGVEQLVETEIPMPTIAEREVLIQVKAISINPVDVKTRAGKGIAGRLKNHTPLVLGWDVSGIVLKTGPLVTQFKEGDEVFGMINFPGHGKAYAEYVAAPAGQLALKPKNISYQEAAAATLAALTAWQAIVHYAKVAAGQRVLIHAAAGGVGHFAVQIAKYLGAYVIGTASAINKDFILGLGADEHIDYKEHRFEEVVSQIDFVLDSIGGDYAERSLNVIKPGGSLISIPTALNQAVTQKAVAKKIQSNFILVESGSEDMASLAGLLARGKLKAHVSHTFSFEQLAQSHLQMETGRTVGKIIINI